MKKMYFIIALFFIVFLSGCSVITDFFSSDNSDEEVVVEQPASLNEPSAVSSDDNTDSTSPSEPETAPSVSRTNYIVLEANLELLYPETYSIKKNTESNRRGSFTSYDFKSKDKADGPILQEVQFFTEKSIKDFNEKCEAQGFPCFYGDYPTIEEYSSLKKGLQEISDYKEFHVLVFNERNYYVKNFSCDGDSCVIRQYTTYFDDIRVDVWINMAEDGQSESADALFKQVVVRPVGERAE